MTGRIWLGTPGNEQLLSTMGRRLVEGDIEITREGRTVSGKLVMDIIAIKKKFTLEYSIVTDEVLGVFRSLFELGALLNLKIERPDESIDEYTVKLRPFSRKRQLLANTWFWEDISIELEEV